MNEAPAHAEAEAMRRTLLLFAETVLRPVVRILLRYGLSYPEFNQISRRLYVDVAMKEPEFRGARRHRQYKSRVACITGLSRKEVLRLADEWRSPGVKDLPSANRAARVLDGWLNDERYRGLNGEPLPLPFRASPGRRSFTELVQAYSGDIPPRAILDELCRAGTCREDEENEVRIIAARYVAQPLDIDTATTTAMRVAAALASADAELAVDRAARKSVPLRVQSSAH